jgi:hypothetical protein
MIGVLGLHLAVAPGPARAEEAKLAAQGTQKKHGKASKKKHPRPQRKAKRSKKKHGRPSTQGQQGAQKARPAGK